MEHFVTLFNSLFLPQGLALHMSMERYASDYRLWVLCVDEETFDILGRLDLPNIRRLKLRDLETPELLKVKPGRTIGEYCWTLTPFAPRFVFESDSTVQRVTYIDADLWFRTSPSRLLDELGKSQKPVLITEHAFSPESDQSATSGKYCVQFVTFTRGLGECVRDWWEKRCIEWCYARHEDGKFGDQRYLDEWPQRFAEEVHVLKARGLALAPWNVLRFPYSEASFYHFHGLRILSGGKVDIGAYELPSAVIDNVYRPYFADLRNSSDLLAKYGHQIVAQAPTPNVLLRIYGVIRKVGRKLFPLFRTRIIKIR